ncbi:nickel-dependent hydrogenase large subunit [Azospirillum thermophilum]|uniref:Hydroxyacid dehydrogenase n=1 Tax=Azospirillum thermophilum TaxID=2202148 RepID=A0A2S2CY91_9PROT|nr:nickel-dependent hydrogenase large subunit [Azospirillum thermophilum]AWK89385.1 hydroxyacid dehydrogenase [Azospirillum thermophilum]
MPYTFPLGPYHPALEEPFKVKVQCQGEVIDSAVVEVGFSFRGIELVAQKRNWVEVITLIERVCGICSNTHAMTFCMAAETIAGIELPRRAAYIRTIIAELERLHSHLLWAGIGAEDIGFHSLFMEVFTLREKVMDTLEAISGNRVNYGMNCIGGVHRDIPDPTVYLPVLDELTRVLNEVVIPTFTQNPTAIARTRGVGPLTREQALEWAVVGPVARASGLDIDVRKDQPYLAYGELGFKSFVQEEGDVFARVVVRALEMLESVRLIREALLSLPAGPLKAVSGLPTIPVGEATIRTEAPRGEAFYYVASEGGNTPARVKIRTPSFVNIPAIEPMVIGQPLADLSIIQASVDPCISCTDR